MLGEELVKKRENAGLSQEELAERISALTGKSLTRQSIQKWEGGTSFPGRGKWAAIEKIFEVEDGWVYKLIHLSTSTGPSPTLAEILLPETSGRRTFTRTPASPPPSPTQPDFVPHKVPLISWVQAGEWTAVVDIYQPGVADHWVPVMKKYGPNAFALTVEGDSMEPEFRSGDYIVVDPSLQYGNGSYVVAKNGDSATFKQLVMEGSSVYLKPLNDRYPIKDMTGIEFKIVGVVVFKGKEY